MFRRRSIVVSFVLLILVFFAACSKMDRIQLKEAKEHYKNGKLKNAAGTLNQILGRSPRNIFAKRLLGKIENELIERVRQELDAKNYKKADKTIDILVSVVHSEREEVKTLQGDVKKHMILKTARKALESDSPGKALALAEEALEKDPQFQEAKEVKETASARLEQNIANLMSVAQELIIQKKFQELEKQAQDILVQDPENKEATRLLREAKTKMLIEDREKNLRMARRFFEKGVYESARKKAEQVLQIDAGNDEAKELLQRSKAEMEKPPIRLVGLTQVKGMDWAQIEILKPYVRYRVREGEEFGDFKVSAIDFEMKTVVVTYKKTGSQQVLEPEKTGTVKRNTVMTLRKARKQQKRVLEHLLQLRLYDLSVFEDIPLAPDGQFESDLVKIDSYWEESGKVPFLIYVDNMLAGFILISSHRDVDKDNEVRAIDEMFVTRKHQRFEFDRVAAFKVFNRYPGGWMIRLGGRDKAVKQYWRSIVASYTEEKYEERSISTQEWEARALVFRSRM